MTCSHTWLFSVGGSDLSLIQWAAVNNSLYQGRHKTGSLQGLIWPMGWILKIKKKKHKLYDVFFN